MVIGIDETAELLGVLIFLRVVSCPAALRCASFILIVDDLQDFVTNSIAIKFKDS